MSRNKAITLAVVILASGTISFFSARLAAIGAHKTQKPVSRQWLAEAPLSVVELEEKFDNEVNELIETLMERQQNLALALEDPCTPDKAILEQVENVIGAHELLMKRVGQHVATLRLNLPAAQRERLMGLCAETVRGPMRRLEGRSGGYGRGNRMGWQDSSRPGRGQAGRGRRGGANGAGYGQRRRYRGGLAQCLSLTEEQMLIAQEQDPDFEVEAAKLRDILLTEMAELLDVFEDPQSTNDELLQQVDKLIMAHSQIERRIASHVLVLRSHLTVEQQKWLIGLCRCSRERS